MIRIFAAAALGATVASAFSVSPLRNPSQVSFTKLLASTATWDDFAGDSSSSGGPTTYRDMDDILFEDKEQDGPPIRIRVKDIDREWDEGSFSVDLILPGETDQDEVKGVAFFMHGFSQYPKAYTITLKEIANEAGVAVVAVETGTTSKIVRRGLKRREDNAQFVLQRAVSQDTIQCINMVLKGEEPFREYIKKRHLPLGLVGHSMGGGLCFEVASRFPNINYVACMAPAPGEPEFDPLKAIAKHTPKNSILMAGGWDVIAKASVVQGLSAACNDKEKDSSLFVKIARGLHTGFQDDITLFSIKLTGVPVRFFIGHLFGRFESLIIRSLQFFRTNTGQLDVSHFFLSWLFAKMVSGETVTKAQAQEALENDPEMKQKWINKVSYGDDE